MSNRLELAGDCRGGSARVGVSQTEGAAPWGRLTAVQREVLDLGAQGFTSKEIARRLDKSPYTIDQRFDRARAVLGGRNRRDAIRRYLGAVRDPVGCWRCAETW